MLINGMLNLAIGLALTFGVVSLVTSAITEGISSALSLRSKTLLAGMKKLLNDPNATGLVLAVYQHAAVNPLGNGQPPPAQHDWPNTKGTYQAVSTLLGNMPSYVDSKGFASALIDVIQNRQQPDGFIPQIKDAIDKVSSPQVRAVLQGFYERGDQDVEKLQAKLAIWFDAAMDRVSGDYKRKAQWISLLIAAAMVVGMDIDSLSIARHIYVDPALVAHVGAMTGTDPLAAYQAWSQTFPFGWGDFWLSWTQSGLAQAIAFAVPGWALTAAATLFGAPFWFDTLQRFVQIRGTGPVTNSDAKKPVA